MRQAMMHMRLARGLGQRSQLAQNRLVQRGIPLAATGLVYPVWAMIAMAASVTAIFINSIGTRPSLLFHAIGSVGRRHGTGTDDRSGW